MGEKLLLAVVMTSASLPVLAGPDSAQQLPEPSTLGLFAAAAIAIAVISKIKK